MFMVAEAVDRDLKKKPNDSHANWSKLLPNVDGYFDACSQVGVHVGGMNVLVPQQTIGPNDKVPMVDDEGSVLAFSDDCDAYAKASVEERMRARADAVPGSAELVVYGSEVLGVRVGTSSGGHLGMRFRTRPPTTSIGTLKIINIHIKWPADMLATAIMVGKEHQSPFVALTHECSAATFKKWGRGEIPEPPRSTRMSLHENFVKYATSESNNPKVSQLVTNSW